MAVGGRRQCVRREHSGALPRRATSRSPSLIVHGDEDDRVPISQGYEFYAALAPAGCRPTSWSCRASRTARASRSACAPARWMILRWTEKSHARALMRQFKTLTPCKLVGWRSRPSGSTGCSSSCRSGSAARSTSGRCSTTCCRRCQLGDRLRRGRRLSCWNRAVPLRADRQPDRRHGAARVPMRAACGRTLTPALRPRHHRPRDPHPAMRSPNVPDVRRGPALLYPRDASVARLRLAAPIVSGGGRDRLPERRERDALAAPSPRPT